MRLQWANRGHVADLFKNNSIFKARGGKHSFSQSKNLPPPSPPRLKYWSCSWLLLYFRTMACLVYSNPFLTAVCRIGNHYHCAWLATSQDSTFYVSIFLFLARERVFPNFDFVGSQNYSLRNPSMLRLLSVKLFV